MEETLVFRCPQFIAWCWWILVIIVTGTTPYFIQQITLLVRIQFGAVEDIAPVILNCLREVLADVNGFNVYIGVKMLSILLSILDGLI
ncbi:MAG: hypothetical protein FJY85_22700 [Deltaproteobacteria bacterium]|nr:hypothetical protein [Deltaproteobacteria bacterium]